MKKIVLTGGGTAGHVTPNIALLPGLKEMGFEVYYIGSVNGMEKELIEKQGIPYFGISSGKLRRYFDLKNFTDPFRVQKGFHQAIRILKELRPNVVFSKGGFVSVPVMGAAKRVKIPAILHESDMTPGLANKLAIPSARYVCCNFPETMQHLPKEKAVLTGCPIRPELLSGDAKNGRSLAGFNDELPVLMIIGGSSGSVHINDAVRQALPKLLERYQVLHLCGKGRLDDSLKDKKGYCQLEYADKELPDFFAAADLVISRAGANAISELLALRKPNILVPLPLSASRGDQILNARSFENQGFSLVLDDEKMTEESLLSAIDTVISKKEDYLRAMEQSDAGDAIGKILELIRKTAS